MICLKVAKANGEYQFVMYSDHVMLLHGYAPTITDYPENDMGDGTHEVVIESNDSSIVVFVNKVVWGDAE